jgi:7-cyano-7-deazaguanine reductase
MDIHDRRQLLTDKPSPDTEHEIRIMYVPDRLVLPIENLKAYFDITSKLNPGSTESLAVELLDDFNNEIVPRWIQIDVFAKGAQITATDRQPGWENQNLLLTIL